MDSVEENDSKAIDGKDAADAIAACPELSPERQAWLEDGLHRLLEALGKAQESEGIWRQKAQTLHNDVQVKLRLIHDGPASLI